MKNLNTEKRRLYLESIHGVPFTTGNSIKILNNGEQIFPAMLQAMEEAKLSINFLTYVYWKGRIAEKFAEVLTKKANEGLTVRVLLDAHGASKMPNKLIHKLKESGVRLEWFRSFKTSRIWNYDNRTHRKALICDNVIAFTGGVGVADEWDGDARNPKEWRDTHFEFKGPSVHSINGAFWDNWLEASSEHKADIQLETKQNVNCEADTSVQVIQSSAARHYSDAAIVMKSIIELADTRLAITTPYMVLDELHLKLLCEKALSGTRVELLIPGEHIDKRFELWAAEKDFDALLEAGVDIYRYQTTMLHTKAILVDDDIACIGSPNFNQRSMRKDDEIIVNIQDHDVCKALDRHYENDKSQSIRAKDTKWARKSWTNTLKHYAIRPFQEQF